MLLLSTIIMCSTYFSSCATIRLIYDSWLYPTMTAGIGDFGMCYF